MLNFQKATNWSQIWDQWELIEHSVRTNTSASQILVQRLNFRFKRLQMETPLSAPDYWLECTKSTFKCHFSHVGGLIYKKCAFKNSSSVCLLWPFWNSSSPWEGLPRPSDCLLIRPLSTNIKTAVLPSQHNILLTAQSTNKAAGNYVNHMKMTDRVQHWQTCAHLIVSGMRDTNERYGVLRQWQMLYPKTTPLLQWTVPKPFVSESDRT